MKRPNKAPPNVITGRFVRTVCQRLAGNKRVRRTLPVWGRLHIDRQLPFLTVYRRPVGRQDRGTRQLILGEASYLSTVGDRQLRPSLSLLVQNVVKTLTPEFGAFLIVEVWSAATETEGDAVESLARRPGFRILAPKSRAPVSTIEALEKALKQIGSQQLTSRVDVVYTRKSGPKGLPPLMSPVTANDLNCFILGLEVLPIYHHPQTGELFPVLLRALHRGLSRALQQAFFEFSRTETTHRPPNYQVLGRRAVVKAVWGVDRELAKISSAFDLLLQVTPVNAGVAWAQFKRRRFERAPVFHYRPLAVDPALLKRRLYAIPLEQVEDPTLAYLFRQKRIELDRKLTMVQDIDTAKFLYGSLQVYGGVDDKMLQVAKGLLEAISPRSRDDGRRGHLDCSAFADRARAEIDYYRQAYPGLRATVQVRPDITGLMVSFGDLLVSRRTRIPASRAEALLQHEVGTHLVTYYNGRAQPFAQLYTGLAGYETLQEGLAVLAEYLVGGLSRPRMRLLAGRVLAVRCLGEGASFVETFRELNRGRGFSQRTAFTITMRVYRGGGLAKDAVYLRGLVTLLDYLRQGGALEPLFVGKITAEDIPLIQELQWRQVLRPAPLRPRYLDYPQTATRLAHLRNGPTLLDLVERRKM
jgi:uncharacterized protein (TIGR02421 family)